jgi:hypothetical protein
VRRTLRLAARPRRRGVTVRVGPAWLAHHVIRVTVSGSRRTMTLPGADPHPGPTRRLFFPPSGGPSESVSSRMTSMRRRAITRAHGLGSRTQSPDSDVGNRGRRIRPAAEAKGPARVRSAAPAVRIRARANSAAPPQRPRAVCCDAAPARHPPLRRPGALHPSMPPCAPTRASDSRQPASARHGRAARRGRSGAACVASRVPRAHDPMVRAAAGRI